MKRAALLFGLFATATVTVAETSGYSLEEAHAYRNAWTLENWDEGGPLMRYVFLNMPEFWTHSIISRGNDARKLPLKLRDDVGAFRTTTDAGKKSLSDYVNNAAVNGAIVVHRGEIVFESYPRMRSQDKHLYMSVAKEFAATLIAILEDRGLIDVSRSVDHYLPSLADSGWAGVPIIDVLDMASGIGCLEMEEDAYSNPERCYYQYEASLGWQKATAATNDSPFDFMATLKSHRPAGEAYEYTSPNTFILGWLAESITAQPLADLISTTSPHPVSTAYRSSAAVSVRRCGIWRALACCLHPADAQDPIQLFRRRISTRSSMAVGRHCLIRIVPVIFTRLTGNRSGTVRINGRS